MRHSLFLLFTFTLFTYFDQSRYLCSVSEYYHWAIFVKFTEL